MKKLQPAAFAISALMASVAHAQVPSSPPQASATAPEGVASDSGEIVVTAQRKSEKLQDTPLAITAVNAETVQRLGLTSIVDISAVTPGASFTTNAGFFSSYIRGLGTNYVSVGVESPVAIYEDGAYLTRTANVKEVVDNFDIGSIQVLRGPQGTLYGRNATAGVIIINSADPVQEFQGKARAEVGNLDHQQIDAMLNAPLGSDLALRVTGGYKHDGGFVHNLTTGEEIGGGRAYHVRAKLRWQPGNADIILGGQYYNTAYSLDLAALGDLGPTCYACILAPGIVKPGGGFYTQQKRTFGGALKGETYGTNLSMNFDFDTFKVTSLSTYRRQANRNNSTDLDLTPLNLFEPTSPFQGGSSYSQELQISSQLKGPFNYVAGLDYLNDKGRIDEKLLGLAFGQPTPTLIGAPEFFNTAKTQSYSAFIEGNYKLSDQLKVTIGGRYTYERRSAEVTQNDALAGLFGLSGFTNIQEITQRAFTPRFVLAWDNGPTNIYYSFTRGFKAGGFPGPYFFPVASVKPEKIFSHEVGIKQSMFNGRLRTNLAAFYFKNKDYQAQSLDNKTASTITQNAGAVENYGIELETQLSPVAGLHLGLSGAWQHARYKPFKDAAYVCYDPTGASNPSAPGATLFPCFTDLTGFATPHAPTWTGSFSTNYEFAIGTWSASLSSLAQYRSAVSFDPGSGGVLKYDRAGGRFLANASGYVSPPGTGLRIGFYANNLFDKKYAAFRSTSQPYGEYYEPGQPRTYGLRVEYMF